MFELCEIEELSNQVNLSILYEIAKNSAQIGNEILKAAANPRFMQGYAIGR